MLKKTMQPCDAHFDKLQKHFDNGGTVLVQPKIDGVKAINIEGKLKGRSLKALDNKFVTEQFSKPEYEGFEGEMILGTDPALPDLCRDSSSALRRVEGEPVCTWYVFDYTLLGVLDLGYHERIKQLSREILRHNIKNVEIVRGRICETMQEVLDYEEECLRDGYEGICIRDTSLPYKQGRAGKTFMGVWRVKRFIDAEAKVIRITEGNHNANEAKTNELGRTERSLHQENLVPNGLLGNMEGELLEDLKDPQTQEVLVKKGTIITISPGEMDHKTRKLYFDNPEMIVNKVVKFKSFPKGLKDKPRFPIFLSIREEFDIAKD
jgi:DNA ligase 1